MIQHLILIERLVESAISASVSAFVFCDEESAHADRDIAIMKYMAKHKAQAHLTCFKLHRKNDAKFHVATIRYIMFNIQFVYNIHIFTFFKYVCMYML